MCFYFFLWLRITIVALVLQLIWYYSTSPANICWSWRRLKNVFSVTILRLPRRLEDVLKTSCKDVLKISCKTKNCYAKDVLKTCLEDMSWRCLEDLLKILWRQAKYLLGISLYLSRDLTNLNVYLTSLYFTNLYLTTLKQIQNALITGDWFGAMKLA